MKKSPISATVDYDKDGVQHGFLRLPYSHDASAWGSIPIPITVAKNGDGPTVLFTGGNHGDEYEGPIALHELAQNISDMDIKGRVIIVPSMNFPAFQAGTRTSPIDKGNMNRVFPGSPSGTATEKIADYFQRVLLPLADYGVDIHSGGKTLDFIPFCATHVLNDKDQQQKCIEAMNAFNAPYSIMLLEIDAAGMYDTAAEEMGKIFISTELGGGGSATAKSAQIAKKGVNNILKYAGILAGDVEQAPSIQLDMPDDNCFVSSTSEGLLEMLVDLGEPVLKGQEIARVHNINKTGEKPDCYHASMDGILTARHYPGLIRIGDILGVIAIKYSGT